jgi:hypothetical protein
MLIQIGAAALCSVLFVSINKRTNFIKTKHHFGFILLMKWA